MTGFDCELPLGLAKADHLQPPKGLIFLRPYRDVAGCLPCMGG
jgi:hypothetical protein